MKRTTAPWKVVREPDAAQIVSVDSAIVASRVRNRADAELVAAAPDLLRACEAALAKSPNIPDWFQVREMLRSAIAQAEGRSNVCYVS
ncbi:MAG TPA: hypothetical protein VLS27_13400 [Gammaproteobacteria bacterium]|nr:hypothetical protein [Gammaproteobacteria bacterium]